VVCGDVEPRGLAVNKEDIFFWGGVLEAHAAGTTEVRGASFAADDAAIFFVGFEKGDLEGLGGAVGLLEARLGGKFFGGGARGSSNETAEQRYGQGEVLSRGGAGTVLATICGADKG